MYKARCGALAMPSGLHGRRVLREHATLPLCVRQAHPGLCPVDQPTGDACNREYIAKSRADPHVHAHPRGTVVTEQLAMSYSSLRSSYTS
jgi:hypothetical protein